MATGTAKRPRGRPRGSTREAILARAIDLASREGLEGLTIGRLASELEMSKSGLFRHFGSKEELQLATVDAAAERFVERVVSPALREPEGEDRLGVLFDGYLTHLEEETFAGGCFWAAAAAEFDDRPGPVRDKVRDFIAAWLELLAREAKAAGADDPEQVSFELYNVGLGANHRSRLFEDGAVFARARAAAERILPD